MAIPSFAISEGNENIPQQIGEYKLITETKGSKNISTVYDDTNQIVAKSIYDTQTGKLSTTDYSNNQAYSQNISPSEVPFIRSFLESFSQGEASNSANVNYKYITTHRGSLKLAGYSAAAIIATVGSIVQRVFRAYDQKGSKIGPTLTGYSTSHHR